MARKRTRVKSPSREVTKAPSMAGSMPEMMKMTAEQKKREERYRLEDDARTVRNYLDLRKDSTRHNKTLTFMRDENNDLDMLDKRDAMPRKARRISARKAGRPRGR